MKLAEAMMSRGLAPMEMPQTPGAKVSPLAPMAQMLQAYLGNKQLGNLDKDRQALGQRFMKEGAEGTQNLVNGMAMQTGEQPVPGDGVGPPAFMTPEQVSQHKRKAIMEAYNHNHPRVQKLGEAMLSESMKGDEAGYHTVGQQLIRTSKKNPNAPAAVVHDGREKWGNMETLGADGSGKPIVGQRAVGTNKFDYPTQGQTINNNLDGTTAAAGGKALAVKRADAVATSFEKTKTVPDMLASLDEAGNALHAGMKTGSLAEFDLALAKFGKYLGYDDKTIANTEVFRGEIAKRVFDILKELKPASNTDLIYADQAAGGKITLDNDAMGRLIDSARASGYNALVDHNKLLQRAEQSKGFSPEDLQMFQVPVNFKINPETIHHDHSSGRFTLKPRAPLRGAAPGNPNAEKSGLPPGSRILTPEEFMKQFGGAR